MLADPPTPPPPQETHWGTMCQVTGTLFPPLFRTCTPPKGCHLAPSGELLGPFFLPPPPANVLQGHPFKDHPSTSGPGLNRSITERSKGFCFVLWVDGDVPERQLLRFCKFRHFWVILVECSTTRFLSLFFPPDRFIPWFHSLKFERLMFSRACAVL